MTETTAPTGPAALHGIERVLVVGAGSSGRAAARLLVDAGMRVVLVDRRAEQPQEPCAPAGVDVRFGTDGIDAFTHDIGLVVPSPGVPQHAPVLVEALRRGVAVWSEPELALRLHPRRLLAVTGTNGKTSSTELLAAMLVAGGVPATACGNIGLPLSEAVLNVPEPDWLVAELSSFQLRFADTLRPHVGILLNLAPDHLDWHGDERAYHAAKARLWEAQGEDDWAVANADDRATLRLRDAAPGRAASFSGRGPVELGVGVAEGVLTGRRPDGTSTGPIVDVAMLGLAPHRIANAAAAATAALLVDVAPEAIGEAVRRFRPGRHRYELVATSSSGVRYIDDSKATNAHAARAALLAGEGPIVWIAGGRAKGVPLDALADDLGAVRSAVLIGEAAPELAGLCERAGVPAATVATIEEAVDAASARARPGDVIVLSPACASFDQFRDYAERGERFAAAARRAAAATQGVRR